MGRKKEVVYANGRYCGKLLDKKTCDKLETLLRVSEENGCISDLKKVIYELPPSSVEMIKQSKSNAFVELERGELEDHQTVGVAYMYFAKRLILGDSVGMGKTVEMAGLFNLIEADFTKRNEDFRFLFLTEKTAVESTANKLISFTGNYVQEVYGEKRYVKKFVSENSDGIQFSVVGSHSLITNVDFQQYIIDYEEQHGYCPFDVLVIDESGDILTNTSTKTYNEAVELRKHFNDYIYLLNATSFEDSLKQFYAQLAFLDDSLLPTKKAFSDEYDIMKYDIRRGYSVPTGKYKNGDKFRDLVSYRYLSRTRKSTGAVMEGCSAEVLVSHLSSEQRMLLKNVSIPNMVYDCPSYFNSSGYSIETNEETTPKLADLVDLISNRLKSERSILVYARYKEAQMAIYTLLDSLGYSVRVMNGETSLKDRNHYINSFKLGDINVLVTNVQKGLDFGNCNHCIFYDYDPSSNKMVQFEGRMTREHDIIDKHAYILVSEGKELKAFKGALADKAKASDMFAGSDFSCVLSILLNDDKLEEIC